MAEKYKRNPNTACVICGKPIYRRPGEIKGGNIFCSSNCYGVSCRKENPCVVCGKMILAGLNKKTCSRGCANKHRAGIKYKIGRPRDKVKSYQALRARLMKVRGNSCQKCGYSKFDIFQVHHKDRNRDNNKLNNLEILCPNCHYEKHHLEGIALNK